MRRIKRNRRRHISHRPRYRGKNDNIITVIKIVLGVIIALILFKFLLIPLVVIAYQAFFAVIALVILVAVLASGYIIISQILKFLNNK
ncbi:MAG: hypothetical protein RR922_04365 [Clostridia bacterium]